jgi:hypothetical protein
MKAKYLSLALVLCMVLGSLLTAYPAKAETTWTLTGFWNDPAVPSIFDWISFGLTPDAPPDILTCLWDFGDGTTSEDCFVWATKQYANDGDYTVKVDVINNLTGEEFSTSRPVSVRTHDVAITKFTVPQSARAGQTRQLVVNVRNTRYPERVQVELYKDDMVWVGTLVQYVPPRSANRTTAFNFNYTFTAEDARVGKVTFRAMAFILDNGGDDWQVDNDAIALPTRVSR